MGFTGFPAAALDFYDDLEMDNSKTFWTERKHVYEESVRAPMVALLAELEPEFGTAKVFRPYRDVRFARDKTPYKTHQGAFIDLAPATGWYVEVAAPGVRVAAGFYEASSERLARVRTAIDDSRRGKQLEALLAELTAAGWSVGGDRLKTTPRGYAADHPRIELLRHKSLTVTKSYGFEPVIHTAELAAEIRADWKSTQPLLTWLTDNS
ncbi:DUF2461 domain-containing protein [Kribbella sandramycini]|uniref:DUF2461 domain-containing protein n=1 Tax=Kribbella sandramycini TaxID=60450 RepID=A0A7Y4KWA6_9ACTN|nr:DUF2461 domain-containing protein [Kribbella sandramycini]MBB6567533.1 uncharacterized protein (TIGR02453 family) [Kribbella sandramycini]NOL39863.1 DUF2461 domain-containing protein [Kribbella sandramycini]